MLGIRRVDKDEREEVKKKEVIVYEMRMIEENGVEEMMRRFMERVKEEEGMLNVRIDVDFIDK